MAPRKTTGSRSTATMRATGAASKRSAPKKAAPKKAAAPKSKATVKVVESSETVSEKTDIKIETAVLPIGGSPEPKETFPVKVARYVMKHYNALQVFAIPQSSQCIDTVSTFDKSFSFIRHSNHTRVKTITNGPSVVSTDIDVSLSNFNVNTYFDPGNRVVYLSGITSVNDLISLYESTDNAVNHTVKVIKVDINTRLMKDALIRFAGLSSGCRYIKGRTDGELILIMHKGDAFSYSKIPVTSLTDITTEQFYSQMKLWGCKELNLS